MNLADRRPRRASRPAGSTRGLRGLRGYVLLAAAPLLAMAAPAALAQDANLGRNLAATCANCHGTNGNARGDMKPLAGMAADKMLAMLADFKSGNQPATIMHQIAKGYSDAQAKAVADYFAAQKPAAK
jgi:sulfide dehydrogenase cytochrome subunit